MTWHRCLFLQKTVRDAVKNGECRDVPKNEKLARWLSDAVEVTQAAKVATFNNSPHLKDHHV